jgi:hypothetical protein
MSRRKRLAVVVIVAVAVSLALTVTAFASTDGIGSGFSLWNLLDGLGGFFRDLINSIGRFIANIISAIKNGFNAALDAMAKIIKAIGNAINSLLSGIKWLFVPSKESFSKFRDDILSSFDKKFGSVFSALNYLNTRFKNLSAKSDLPEIFKITFPKSSFLYGVSINLLSSPLPVLQFIRICMTGFCCLITAISCYHMVIGMVEK